MLKWTIGDVTVTRIVEMEMLVKHHPDHGLLPMATPDNLAKMPWLFPHFVEPDGSLKLSIHALLVEAPGLRLVVDTCIGNDKPRGATRRVPLATNFLEKLSDAGWTRDSVNTVVCTHLHVDHVGWNTMKQGNTWIPTFPKARHLISKTEFNHWSKEGDKEQQEILADSVRPIIDAGLVDWVDPDHRISPEVRLMPTTGHTPGHVSVVIESQGAAAIITGDLIHHPCQVAHPEWQNRFDHDSAAAIATRSTFVESYADRPVLIIGTHFAAPTAGHIRRSDSSYRFEGRP